MVDLIMTLVSCESGSIVQSWPKRLSAGNSWYGEHGIHLNLQSQTTPSSIYILDRRPSGLFPSSFDSRNADTDRLIDQLTTNSV